MRRFAGLVVLVIAACVAGCGTTVAPSPSPAPTVRTGPSSSAASGLSSTSTASPVTRTSASVSAMHGAPELEAMLPSAIGTLPTTRASFSGLPEIAGTTTFPPTHDGLAGLLELLAKCPADLRGAMATTGTDAVRPTVSVLQVQGVDASQLAWMSGVSHAALSATTIGGKPVLVQSGLEALYVIYENGELLFLLQRIPVADQPAVLAALP